MGVELLGAPEDVKAEILLKKAQVHLDRAECGMALAALQAIASDKLGQRAENLRARAEGGR